MDGVQITLIIIVVVLALFLIAASFQLIMILIDLRRAVKRLNSILDDSVLGGGLLRPEKITKIFQFLRKKRR